MRGMSEALDSREWSAEAEPRAFFYLCSVKEFLVVATIVLIFADIFDIYANIIRVSGTDLLPFPGNHSQLYYTSVPELSWYDMAISIGDLCAVLLLSLSGA